MSSGSRSDRPQPEAQAMMRRTMDAPSRQHAQAAQPNLEDVAAGRHRATEGLHKSQELDAAPKDCATKQLELTDELGASNMQEKKSINNLDQFEKASSGDSHEEFRPEPSNAQSIFQSEDKYPINE